MSVDGIEVGTIEWLDIREVWKHEAAGFTPWLLKNVRELADALDIEFELEQSEHAVGNSSLDLIGRDLKHDVRLIVENQIEQSDHGHLGQLLTYTAGTDAKTIVWVARGFREEHRVALDWLNEHTDEDTRFFGVVVKALKIGDSLPAPFFELVAKPNEWQKAVRQTVQGQENAQAALYREFWRPMREAIAEHDPGLLTGKVEPKSIWLTIASPFPKTSLSAEIGAGELRVSLGINTGYKEESREENLRILHELEAHRASLEATIGPLDFLEGAHLSKIVLRKPWDGKLIEQPERHDEARAWLLENLLAGRRAFETIVMPVESTGLQ